MLYTFYLNTPESAETILPVAFNYETVYPRIERRLESLERKHKASANFYSALTRVLQYALLGGTACTATLAASSLHDAFPVSFSVICVVLAAALSLFRFSDRVRTQERLSDYFKALRNEVANILTSAGDINEQPKYYEKSIAAIENMINDISASRSSQGA